MGRKMNFREAEIKDIKELHMLRLSVRENMLRNPLLVTEADYHDYLTTRGKGWVCEIDNAVVGFAIIDAVENNIWALFVKPDYEKKGIGRRLHDLMINWFFQQSDNTLWLGTAPNTRAETFYRSAGWNDSGRTSNGEIKFEMTFKDWENRNS